MIQEMARPMAKKKATGAKPTLTDSQLATLLDDIQGWDDRIPAGPIRTGLVFLGRMQELAKTGGRPDVADVFRLKAMIQIKDDLESIYKRERNAEGALWGLACWAEGLPRVVAVFGSVFDVDIVPILAGHQDDAETEFQAAVAWTLLEGAALVKPSGQFVPGELDKQIIEVLTSKGPSTGRQIAEEIGLGSDNGNLKGRLADLTRNGHLKNDGDHKGYYLP